jgi:hypothetical protein
VSQRAIARREQVSRWFVRQWTATPCQSVEQDGRGWKKGRPRHYTHADEQRVLRVHRALARDPRCYFSGASAVQRELRRRYPGQQQELSLQFIGRTLAKGGYANKRRGSSKGASAYLHYPKHLIAALGASLLEVDFIGKKFITGRTAPVNFLAFSLTQPRRVKHFTRVEAETASEAIRACERFFGRCEVPEVVKIDNGFAFAGAGPEARTLNSFVFFLLGKKITPVFTAPRKPWNQASIEGSNSIFSRAFWHREQYTSLQMIDRRLKWFNASYERYSNYQRPKRRPRRSKPFGPKVYFIRKVYEDDRTGKAWIEVLKERIALPQSYLGMFVLAEWNLKRERLRVLYEEAEKATLVKELSFRINKRTKKTGGTVLFDI